LRGSVSNRDILSFLTSITGQLKTNPTGLIVEGLKEIAKLSLDGKTDINDLSKYDRDYCDFFLSRTLA
jgi:hypothetical protein